MQRRMTRLTVIGSLGIALALPFCAMADQARDATAATPQGRSVIRGVVMSADETPRPIRRAVVTLGGTVPNGRSVVTGDDGAFEFAGLPAGQFTVTATKAASLPAAFGAMRPGRQGTPIVLADGQVMSIRLTMSRGAVVSGTLRDADGQPVAGAGVAVVDAHSVGGFERAFSSAGFVTTDDRGLYRVFGLAPSEYVIVAVQEAAGLGEIGRRTAAESERLLAELQQRRARPPGAADAAPAPPPLPPSFSFAPTYFPGTPRLRDASRVRVVAGEIREGVDFVAGAVPVARISGVVAGDVRNFAAVRLVVILDGMRLPVGNGTTPVLSQAPDAQGRFSYSNVAPGRYRIMARATRGDAEPAPASGAGGGSSSGMGSGNPALPAGSDLLFAVADVDILGQDISGLALTLQPGSTMAGRVRFDGETPVPPNAFTSLRLGVSPPDGTYSSNMAGTTIGNTFIGASAVSVGADGTFEIRNIGPGVVALSSPLPATISSTWWLRSAIADGVDLLDAPFEIQLGVDLRDVTITLSDRRTELSGTLQTPTGQPAPEYFIVVFPAAPDLRRAGSRRIKAVRPTTTGRFVVPDLPAGEYLLGATLDVMPNEWNDPAFLERLAPSGVRVTLGEGEKKVQDIRIAGGS